MSIIEERASAASEAATWVGTPYHHLARVKGEGVDCAQLLYGVFNNCGLIPTFDIDYYPHDWHLHQGAERYLGYILDHAKQREDDYVPLPADIIIWRVGRVFSHAGIIINYPKFVHAYTGRDCNYEYVDKCSYLNIITRGNERGKMRERRIYTLTRWME